MSKLKLGVIFGGMSTENEVSVATATSILNNLDREKYEIYPIYIGKDGIWYEYEEMGGGLARCRQKATNAGAFLPVGHAARNRRKGAYFRPGASGEGHESRRRPQQGFCFGQHDGPFGRG